jgi:microcin C transport system permease protein
MTFPRKIGLLLILVAVAAAVSHEFGWALPSLRWFYSFNAEPGAFPAGHWRYEQGRWVGHALSGGIALAGLAMMIFGGGFQWNPLTLRKFARFRSIGRGWTAFRLLMLLFVVAMLDQAVVGKRALAIRYEGRWLFPAFQQRSYAEKDFGGEGEQETDYRRLAERFRTANQGDLAVLPPVPWDPTFDSDDIVQRPLDEREGVLNRENQAEPYNGHATRFRADHPEVKERMARFRHGLQDGATWIYDEQGQLAGRETWERGKLVDSKVQAGYVAPEAGGWVEQIYSPAPPSWKERHYLGTDSKGWDIAAQLFGGMQVLLKASALYLVLTYSFGITLGSLMGYFGGVFDITMQRLIEILSNVPFLLVVMIITMNIGRDAISLTNILLTFAVFSWIDVAVYLRSSTFREKARDYVAAARVQGAGTARVIFRHILPNAVSTIVTLLPFSVAGLVTALTAMDFLGFGLPDRYPSWGRLLEDGTSNLGSIWIVSSVFGAMVSVLLLITFIGEAIREAFDPKKFTTYR